MFLSSVDSSNVFSFFSFSLRSDDLSLSLSLSRQTPSTHDDRASECSSTTSSKPPVYPLTPTGQMRHGYSTIGMKQRELRTKLHKTRYAQALRQTNTSPTPSDSPSARRFPVSDQHCRSEEKDFGVVLLAQYIDENPGDASSRSNEARQ